MPPPSELPLAVTDAPPTIAAASAEIPIIAAPTAAPAPPPPAASPSAAPPPAPPPAPVPDARAAPAAELSLDRLPPGAAVLAPQRDATRSAAVLRSMFDTVAVVLIVGGAAFAALLFTPAARNEAFKLFAIGYFSLLPAFLYLQFMSVRGPTLWEEFTENLYRLQLDEPASLPRPLPHCRYYRSWQAGTSREPTKTLYQKKFEGVFGAVPCDDHSAPVLIRDKLPPVAVATILFTVAWVLVVMPSPLFNYTLLGKTPDGSASPYLPVESLRFGFLGAYFYSVQMLVRRYFQNDLKASAYLNATMRIVVVALLTWTVDLVFRDQSAEFRSTFAFTIGVFPDVGWKALQAAFKVPLRPLVRSLEQPYPLSDLDGLNVWYEARLLEEGIEDMQNLATCNLVDVMLNTRIPVERLVDWIDQSILFLHLGKTDPSGGETPRERLRRYGIRTATDLEDAFHSMHSACAEDAARIAKLELLLNTKTDDASVLRTIIATLRREPNLPYVRAWRRSEDPPRAALAPAA